MKKSIRNIGIVAHVDAGKTTVTEQFLYSSGAIGQAGSVDKGTSTSDSLNVERERGISVRLATASFNWLDVQINLIDTPGHVDFCAEVERSLRVLDCAVLVLSAVEGVQAHTETIFKALAALNIPTIIFINKIDRIGANPQAVISEIHNELTKNCLELQEPVNLEKNEANLGNSWNADSYTNQRDCPFISGIVESIIECDDTLLEQFLDGQNVQFFELENSLAASVAACKIYPVLYGVAKKTIGIEPLLDAIVRYLPAADAERDKVLSGMVFKIGSDKNLGRICHVRLFQGQINTRDLITNNTRRTQEKVTQLRKIYTGKYEEIKSLEAGDIGVVCGLSSARVGDVLGSESDLGELYSLAAPLLTVQAVPNSEDEFVRVAEALAELTEEDPLLDLQWLHEQRELHLKITGWIQIEVLQAILKDRYQLSVSFESPTIIYKETPRTTGHGFERYWMPKPCWAIVKFLIEPGTIGSGVKYKSLVGTNDIANKYQNEIERTISKALVQGIKGWEVTDLKITLIEGADHNIHTRPGDFIIATPMAMMNGLVETDTTLLEPILDFRISAATELLGTITSDLTRMRAIFETPVFENERFNLVGKIPAATSLDYPIKLASRSGGKAKISTTLRGYEPCELDQGKVVAFRGISPLDRAQYILQARGAM